MNTKWYLAGLGLTIAATSVGWAWLNNHTDILLYLTMGLTCVTGLGGLVLGVGLARYLMAEGAKLSATAGHSYASIDAANIGLLRELLRELVRATTRQPLQLPAPTADEAPQAWLQQSNWLPDLVDFQAEEQTNE